MLKEGDLIEVDTDSPDWYGHDYTFGMILEDNIVMSRLDNEEPPFLPRYEIYWFDTEEITYPSMEWIEKIRYNK